MGAGPDCASDSPAPMTPTATEDALTVFRKARRLTLRDVSASGRPAPGSSSWRAIGTSVDVVMGSEPAHYNRSFHDVYGVRHDVCGFGRILSGLWRRPQGRRRSRHRLHTTCALPQKHVGAHAILESDHHPRIPRRRRSIRTWCRAGRPLPDPGPARPWRHGGSLPRRRSVAGPVGRAEVPARYCGR